MRIFPRLVRRAGIRTKLIIAYIFLISVPMLLSGINNYATSRNTLYEVVSKNVHEIVKKNNEILDQRLRTIRNNCWNMLSDNELIGKSSSMVLDNDFEMISMDIELTRILDKYFLSSQDISFAQLITSRYIFGYGTILGYNRKYIPIEAFIKSPLYEQAMEANGKLVWFPTYNFSAMFGRSGMPDAGSERQFMFSALQRMKTSNIRFGNPEGSRETVENPILILNFGEDFYRKVFKSSSSMDYSRYFVIARDGHFISHQDKEKIGQSVKFPWLDSIYREQSGQKIVDIDGRKTLICFDVSDETGWMSVIAVDYNSLLGDIISSVRLNTFYTVIALTLIPILVSYFVSSMISKPIIKLSKAIKKTGDGDFNSKIPEEEDVEFNSLIKKFNSMNEKIRKLIQENYEIKIKEKEAEINALTLQLNPHFMYNMLNLLNLKLIRNGQDEASEMVANLSTMLKYTARNRNTLVPFEQELDYLKSYVNIMLKRFEGRFDVEYAIDPEMYEYSVPKFLLQPFVENSIIHGFESVKEGGIVKIICSFMDGRREFVIEDNGKGMDDGKIREIMEGRTNSVGIINVINRIRIIYDGDYTFEISSGPARGTIVRISLPPGG